MSGITQTSNSQVTITPTIIDTPQQTQGNEAIKEKVGRGYDNTDTISYSDQTPSQLKEVKAHNLDKPNPITLGGLQKTIGELTGETTQLGGNTNLSPSTQKVIEKEQFAQTVALAENTTGQTLNDDDVGFLNTIVGEMKQIDNDSISKGDQSVAFDQKLDNSFGNMRQSLIDKGATEADLMKFQDLTDKSKLLLKTDGVYDTLALSDAIVGGLKEDIASIHSEADKLRQLISGPMDQWDKDSILTQMAHIKSKIEDKGLKADMEQLELAQETKEATSDKAIKVLEEKIEKEESKKIADMVNKVFSYIGMALAAIVAVVAIATGNVAAAVLLMTAVVIAAVMMADQETNGAVTKPLADGLVAAGVDREKAEQGVQYAMMALELVVSIAAMVASGGSSASSSVSTIAKIAQTTQKVMTGIDIANSIVTASGTIATGVLQYEASMLEVEGKGLEAQMLKQQAMMDLIQDSMDEMMAKIVEMQSKVSQMISQSMSSAQKLSKNIGA